MIRRYTLSHFRFNNFCNKTSINIDEKKCNIEQLEAYYGLVHFRIIKIEFYVFPMVLFMKNIWGYKDVYQYYKVVSAKYVVIISVMVSPHQFHLVKDVPLLAEIIHIGIRW